MSDLPSRPPMLERLLVWLRRPVSYQLRSVSFRISHLAKNISGKIRQACGFDLLAPAKSMVLAGVASGNRRWRGILFDCAHPASRLLSHGGRETFYVTASDRMIGRTVFVLRQPFDFDKFAVAVTLLGPGHARRLLIDVGANIGTVCIPAVKRGLFEKAVAIEPEPRNYSLLMANISINGLGGKIAAHNCAAGEYDDESRVFELSGDNHGDHRIRAATQAGRFNEDLRETIVVRSNTLDKLTGQADPAATLIWIDTQGFEGYVLAGATHALMNRTPLCLEFWPYGMARSGCYARLKDALIKNGYRRFYPLDGSGDPVPLTAEALDGLYERLGEQGNFTDLLVV